MRDVASRVRAVGKQNTIGLVHEDVDVFRAAGIMAWEDGYKLGNAVIVRRLDATQEGRVLNVTSELGKTLQSTSKALTRLEASLLSPLPLATMPL